MMRFNKKKTFPANSLLALVRHSKYSSAVHCLPASQILSRPSYSSLAQASCLSSRSSLAIRRVAPHRDLTASNTLLWISCFSACGIISQTMLIKRAEQSNFFASFHRLHATGSSVRSLLISITSSTVKWYFCLFGALVAQGSSSGAMLMVGSGWSSFLRMSFLGRNMFGVWVTAGALDGGLNIILSNFS